MVSPVSMLVIFGTMRSILNKGLLKGVINYIGVILAALLCEKSGWKTMKIWQGEKRRIPFLLQFQDVYFSIKKIYSIIFGRIFLSGLVVLSVFCSFSHLSNPVLDIRQPTKKTSWLLLPSPALFPYIALHRTLHCMDVKKKQHW